MNPASALDLSLPELALAIRSGRTAAADVVAEMLSRMQALDGAIGAVVATDPDGALLAAQQVDASIARGDTAALGDFAGVPMLVKDLNNVAGMPTTFGARSMATFIPPFDDHTVALMRAAGFVMVGKTATPEIGSLPVTESLLHGATRTPWSPDHTAGGSSGGAAAAVAAGYLPAAHGSDGGGSIRIPASCCGVLGLKPSRGRVSHAPLFGDQVMGYSTQGPLGRRVADVACLLDVLQGPATGDPYHLPAPARPFRELAADDPGPMRIGLIRSLPWVSPTGDVEDALELTATRLGHLGHSLTDLAPALEAAVIDQFIAIWSASVAATPLPRELLEQHNADFAAHGDQMGAADLLRCFSSLQLASRAFVGQCEPFDVVLAPVLMGPPLRIGQLRGLAHRDLLDMLASHLGLTPVLNVTGQPAMSVPALVTHDGLPVGVQLIGPYAQEARLLQLATQLERTHGWPAPPIRGDHRAR